MQPDVHDDFSHILRVIQDEIRSRIVPSHTRSADRNWGRWVTFCQAHYLDPFVCDLSDLILILQVIETHYISGEIAPRSRPKRADMVDDAICAIGQGFTSMGAHDIHNMVSGDILFCLQHIFMVGKSRTTPSTWFKPIPIQIQMVIISLMFSDHPSDAS
jgi:hypothetical protein